MGVRPRPLRATSAGTPSSTWPSRPPTPGEIIESDAGRRPTCRAGLASLRRPRRARASVLVNTLDPDVLVLGGGMSNVDELYDDLPARARGETFSTVFHTPVVRAAHGDSSGVRGAAWLWR